MTTDFLSELSKALPSALLGLIPIGMTALFSWMEERDTQNKRESAIAAAHKQVDFINDWVRAHKTCTSTDLEQIKADAAQELKQLKQNLAQTFVSLDAKAKQRRQLPAKRTLLQKLFLAYRPVGIFTWVLHVIYYMLIALSVFFLAFCAIEFIADEDGFWTDLWAWLIALTMVGIPLIITRALAIKADKRARHQQQQSYPAPPSLYGASQA